MKKSTIQSKVLQNITSGKVRMKSRMHFMLISTLTSSIILLLGLATAYLSSIAFYWVRIQTADTMALGARANLDETISSFPWVTVVMALSLSFITVLLVRRSGQMYRHKLSTIVALLLLCIGAVGVALSLLNIGSGHLQNHPHQLNQGSSQGRHKNE